MATGLSNPTKGHQNITFSHDPNNQSVQTVKPSTAFSPGDTIQRKNDTIVVNKQIMPWDKQSPQQKFNPSPVGKINNEQSQIYNKTTDLYNNMKKQLQKQRSLQTLFNTTQKIGSNAPSKHPTSLSKQKTPNPQIPSQLDNQRAVVRRGAQYNTVTSGQNSINQTAEQSTSKIINVNQNTSKVVFKNAFNSTLTRNRSAFLNFNSTQPIQSPNQGQNLGNKSVLDMTGKVSNRQEKHKIEIMKKQIMHKNKSPSISSDGNDQVLELSGKKSQKPEKLINLLKAAVPSTYYKLETKGSHRKKKSQIPNGSFIEQKMKNCLHSRNNVADQSAQAYQTYQGEHNTDSKKNVLQKNMSQPLLNKNVNLTQRGILLKSSFLRHDDSNNSRSITPLNGQSNLSRMQACPSREDKLSTASKTTKIPGLKGDLKSLNLSPIIPQNLNKEQPSFKRDTSHSDYRTAGADSVKKRIEMRKQSCSSNNNSNATKTYNSLRKDFNRTDQVQNKKLDEKDAPTTEKKQATQCQSINTLRNQKPGYSSQETERGPGATNSYSTTDDFNFIDHYSQLNLRVKREQNSQDKTTQQKTINKNQSPKAPIPKNNNIAPLKQGQTILNKKSEGLIKVNQILSNNNISNSNRYNENEAQDINDMPFIPIYQPTRNVKQIGNNQTPKAFPLLRNQNINLEDSEINDNDRTLKKHETNQSNNCSSDFDEEEDMPDAKDFEEFDYAQPPSNKQSVNVKVQIIDQQQVYRELKGNQKNIMANYNTAANTLAQAIQYYQSSKDDRNSVVNYDTSLLTHNTGRGERNSSPFQDMKHSTIQQKCQGSNKKRKQTDDYTELMIPFTQNYMINETDEQSSKNIQQTDDHYYDQMQIYSQEEDEMLEVLDERQKLQDLQKSKQFKQLMHDIQQKEEEEIEHLTQRILLSRQYREIKNDRDKAKYLSQRIMEVRQKYKQALVEKLLSHQ